jgi:hypothetical protein
MEQRSEKTYEHAFGTKRPQIQILSPRPLKPQVTGLPVTCGLVFGPPGALMFLAPPVLPGMITKTFLMTKTFTRQSGNKASRS